MYGNNYGYYNPTRSIGVPTQNMSNQFMQQPIQQIQPMMQNVLQGKIVDSVEVAKSQDYPMDGSISYFAIANGSAIVTKQLQNDGTSKITIYKPIEDEKEEKEQLKYITIDDFDKKIDKLDNSELLDTLSENIESLTKEIKELKKVKEK